MTYLLNNYVHFITTTKPDPILPATLNDPTFPANLNDKSKIKICMQQLIKAENGECLISFSYIGSVGNVI